MSEYQKKLAKAKLLEEKLRLQKGLPHLYGLKHYEWSRSFFESRKRETFLCASNQSGKSSAQIRKAIHWATAPALWPELWPQAQRPYQFWYLYPTKDVTTIEIEKKWIPQFLPRGEFVDHPVYGWKLERRNKSIFAIHFNTQVSIYFKTYAQDAQDLQTGTVDALFCFVAGTEVLTPEGPRGVEEIRPGDTVLSKDGWAKVVQTMSRTERVITRRFSNGQQLTGTPEHPIWTKNRGWIQLGDLRQGDKCVELPIWNKLIRKLFCFRENFTLAIPSIRITGLGTTSALGRMSFYTLPFGKLIMGKRFLRAMSSIIGTTTPWIIGSGISSSLHAPSTPPTTSERSGSPRGSFLFHVGSVGGSFCHEAQSGVFPGTVRKSVGSWLIGLVRNVFSAAKNFLAGKIRKTCTVLELAATETRSVVYNLEVEGSHTYFANGILTHNCDEELPSELWPELNMRRVATRGYFHMVFTATLGQEFWRETMEERGTKLEKFPDAWKRQVSMYDCLKYEDGSPSPWSIEEIETIKNSCASQAEIDRRVYGKFVLVEGRKYPAFDRELHMKAGVPPARPPDGWLVYSGTDVGSGGDRHPSSHVFVAVRPDFQQARVFKAWRGDGITTTAADVLAKHQEMRHGLPPLVQARYDYHAKDFFTIASRAGETFLPAEKSHEIGVPLINVLFKNGMLTLDTDDAEINKLAIELCNVQLETPKNKAKDDLVDALRYCVASIPWDWSAISDKSAIVKVQKGREMSESERARRGLTAEEEHEASESALLDIENELDAAQELYDI